MSKEDTEVGEKRRREEWTDSQVYLKTLKEDVPLENKMCANLSCTTIVTGKTYCSKHATMADEIVGKTRTCAESGCDVKIFAFDTFCTVHCVKPIYKYDPEKLKVWLKAAHEYVDGLIEQASSRIAVFCPGKVDFVSKETMQAAHAFFKQRADVEATQALENWKTVKTKLDIVRDTTFTPVKNMHHQLMTIHPGLGSIYSALQCIAFLLDPDRVFVLAN